MLTAGNEMCVKLILCWGASLWPSGRQVHTHTQTSHIKMSSNLCSCSSHLTKGTVRWNILPKSFHQGCVCVCVWTLLKTPKGPSWHTVSGVCLWSLENPPFPSQLWLAGPHSHLYCHLFSYLHFHSMEVKGNHVNVMGEFNHAGDLQYVLQVQHVQYH